MTKQENLFNLYQQREQAAKRNPLNNSENRLQLLKEIGAAEMWKRFDEYDAPRVDIQKKIDALIKIYNPQAVKIDASARGFVSVLVEDKRAGFSAWVDISIDDGGDVCPDWNKYIFYLTDAGDVFDKLHQENEFIFESFTNTAIYAAIEHGYIIDNGDGYTMQAGKPSKILPRRDYQKEYRTGKAKARAAAIDYQNESANAAQSYAEIAAAQDHFTKRARRFGLVKEFKENGII